MKKAWLMVADRFDALKPRERLIVFLGLTAAIVMLFYLFVFKPAFDRYQRAHDAIQQSEVVLTSLREQELALVQASAQDPDADMRRMSAQLVADNERVRNELSSAQAQLATPEKMTSVLRDLIESQRGLELVSIRSGKVEDLLVPTASGSSPAVRDQSIFRHSIALTVRGDYAVLASYMRKVEALPWKIHLADLSLDAAHYPVSTMSITVYTLSLERAWLGF